VALRKLVLTDYLHQSGYVFVDVKFVCLLDCAKSTQPIFTEFG